MGFWASGEVTAFVLGALAAHRKDFRRNGTTVPNGIKDFESMLVELMDAPNSGANGGQQVTTLASPQTDDHGEAMPLMYDYATAARMLSIAPRSLKRLTASGDIPTVVVGRTPRIRATDLSDYVNSLEAR